MKKMKKRKKEKKCMKRSCSTCKKNCSDRKNEFKPEVTVAVAPVKIIHNDIKRETTVINPSDCLTVVCFSCFENCNDYFITFGVLMGRDNVSC